MSQYTPTQCQAVLCMLAYVSSFVGGSVTELQAAMAEKLRLIFALNEVQTLIGRWEVVWGPAIYQADKSTVADNTMFVARSLDEARLVVSIAGTNPYSWYNWLFEDFPVRRKQVWPTYTGDWSGFNPKISHGTANGLRVLQAMRFNSQTLVEFLLSYLSEQAEGLTITVTGHSLGGALAPATAVYLADTQSTWDREKRAAIWAMPIAGPTAGDLDFALYGEQMLNGRIQRIWNEKDVIPHAWDQAQMRKLAALYTPAITPNGLVRFCITVAQRIANRANYAHLQPDAPPLSGTLVPNEQITAVLPASLLTKLLPDFMLQMGYQHLEAYYHLLAIEEFGHIMGDKLPNALSGPDLDELRRRVAAQAAEN